MTESNNWSGELEEIFRSHENRIEHELHKMSESFEMCTPHEDITFMSNFFDYLSYRWVICLIYFQFWFHSLKDLITFYWNLLH